MDRPDNMVPIETAPKTELIDVWVDCRFGGYIVSNVEWDDTGGWYCLLRNGDKQYIDDEGNTVTHWRKNTGVDWQPIETAPKDRVIKLKAVIMGYPVELTGWWEPTMTMWTSGGMSLFNASAWAEPTLKDGLRLAHAIVMASEPYTTEDIAYRNRISALLNDQIGKSA